MTTDGSVPKFKVGDATWHRLRKRGLEDLFFFGTTILGYGDRVPMTEAAHLILCRVVSRKTGNQDLDTAPVRKIESPRGTGKTTVVTQAYILQRVCQNPEIAILLANEKAETAQAILSEIKTQIETNDLLRSLYPEIVPDDLKDTTWSATKITVKRTQSRKEATVATTGVSGTVVGMHFDLIFVDDMLSKEAMESARAGSAADVMGTINRWVNQLPALLSSAPDREIIFCGTRWWYGDSYEHVETSFGFGQDPIHVLVSAKFMDGTIQKLPAYRVGDLVVFRRSAIEDGQPAFVSLGASKFGLEALAKERMRDPELFAANMQNEPTDELTATFKDAWLRYFDLADKAVSYLNPQGVRKTTPIESLDVLAFVDPGGFGKGKGPDRARPAIVITGTTSDGLLQFILDVYSERSNYTAAIRELVSMVRSYGVRKVYIELAGQQIVFINNARDALRKEGLTVPVEAVPVGQRSKDDRILGLEDYFERSRIYIGSGGKYQELLDQIKHFPKGVRKDLLDCLSQGPAKWKKAGPSTRSHAQRQAAELAEYHRKRGFAA